MISFLRNLLFHDFWLKLFSLALAVLIWLTVWFARGKNVFATFTNRGAEQNYFNVPVLVILPAADIRNVQVNPSVVAVTLQGEPGRLRELKTKEIHAQVDLTGIESARGLHLQVEIILPPGITYTRVIPNEVEVIIPPKQ
jgi:hypothetical protein